MNDNLLIVFTTDNGGPTEGRDSIGSSNFPLRGGKHTIWEGGTRATAVVWASDNLMPARLKGTEMEGMMHGVDWLPTLVEAVGAPLGPSWKKLDGISQWLAFSEGKPTKERTSFLYGKHDHGEQRWKSLEANDFFVNIGFFGNLWKVGTV